MRGPLSWWRTARTLGLCLQPKTSGSTWPVRSRMDKKHKTIPKCECDPLPEVT